MCVTGRSLYVPAHSHFNRSKEGTPASVAVLLKTCHFHLPSDEKKWYSFKLNT